MKSIEQQICENAKANPDKIAVVSGKQQATYAELKSRIFAAKYLFESRAFYSKGSTVIVAASKQIGFVYAYFGAHLANLQVVPIDLETNPIRFQHIVDSVNPICVIGFDKMETPIAKLSLKDFDDIENDDDNPIDFCFPNEKDIADVLFTTGTTGTPKGVALSFENESAAALNINTFIANTADDVELLALPISHSFGLGRLRCCLSLGATIILLGSFVNVKRIFRLIEDFHVTGFTMVPASWKFLQKFSGDELSKYASQLNYIEMGSAYFSESDKRYLADLFPNTRVTMHYGLTEASRSAFMEFHTDEKALGSVGKASPNTDIRIFDDNGNIVVDGSEGEICICGNHVTKGYINVPNDGCFYGKYFRTGDWGTIDSEGYIYLKSRKKELINVGGKKVSPNEVEDVLKTIEGVWDCVCVATPDPEGILGEVVKAFIVKQTDDVDFEYIREQVLHTSLESYKHPVIYESIDEIPKTQNGKILRSKLV